MTFIYYCNVLFLRHTHTHARTLNSKFSTVFVRRLLFCNETLQEADLTPAVRDNNMMTSSPPSSSSSSSSGALSGTLFVRSSQEATLQ
uniref:Uncharacterized protein n=1 Tax=Anguilla anguilla TaxID=7936 RepID=A0A0E9W2N1_ANGAN